MSKVIPTRWKLDGLPGREQTAAGLPKCLRAVGLDPKNRWRDPSPADVGRWSDGPSKTARNALRIQRIGAAAGNGERGISII
jgi:hypothetical protein